ncbi:MAG: tetratricopeptide repeat protein [Gammaproteobacteria bacterium]|nr:tetratricopeptide repeat protein [Gammaproteobacteria bacterium]
MNVSTKLAVLIISGLCSVSSSVAAQATEDSKQQLLESMSVKLQSGISAFEAGEWKSAVKGFKEVLAEEPKNNTALFYLARTYFELQELDDAEEVFEEALEQQPNSAEEHYWFARVNASQAMDASIFTAAGYANDSLDHFKLSVKVKPDFLAGHIGLFNYYLGAPSIVGGSKDKAAEVLEQIKPLSLSDYHVLKLNLLRANEQFEESLKFAESLLSSMQTLDSKSGFYAVLELQRQKQYEAAATAFESLSQRYAKDKNDRYSLMALYQLGRTSVLASSMVQQGISAFESYLSHIELIEPEPAGPSPEMGKPNLPEAYWAQLRLAQLKAVNTEKEAANKIIKSLSAAKIDNDYFQDELAQAKKLLR